MSSSALAKATSLAAAAAVLSTLGAAGSALAVRMGGEGGGSDSFPDGQQVSAPAPDSLRLTVPPKSQGWEVPSAPEKMTYEGGSGSAQVQALAIYEKGYCTPKYSSSDDQEAFLGLVGTTSAPTSDDLETANSNAAKNLGAALAYQMAKSHEIPEIDYGEETLDNGSTARTATFSVEPIGDTEDCVNPEISASVYSVEHGGRISHVVGIWDSQGSGSLLSAETVGEILQTTDPR